MPDESEPMTDMTGKPPSAKDVQEALEAVSWYLVGTSLLKLPPELAVNLANIRRCLQELERRRRLGLRPPEVLPIQEMLPPAEPIFLNPNGVRDSLRGR